MLTTGAPAQEMLTVDTATAYWGAIVAIAPVLGLALIVEARRGLTKASSDHKGYRRYKTIVPAVGLLLLSQVFTYSLVALSNGYEVGWVSSLINVLLGAIFTAVAVEPLLDLAIKANTDLVAIAVQFLPFSGWWRLLWDRLEIIRLVRQVLVLQLEALEAIEHSISLSKYLLKTMTPETRKALEEAALERGSTEREDGTQLDPEKAPTTETLDEFLADWDSQRSLLLTNLGKSMPERLKTLERMVESADRLDEVGRDVRSMRPWRLDSDTAAFAKAQIEGVIAEYQQESGRPGLMS
jgi:hypothetical protein